jgi:hypothetical protein
LDKKVRQSPCNTAQSGVLTKPEIQLKSMAFTVMSEMKGCRGIGL